MKLLKGILLTSLVVGWSSAAQAEVRLASLFTDNLVLQRDQPAPVWGTAAPGESVSVAFAGQRKTATADANGRWLVTLEPLAANAAPAELSVQGGNAIVLKNVLVGEVWLCSGQSNMEMGIGNAANASQEIAGANQSGIRLFLVPNSFAPVPRDAVAAQWKVCSPKTVAEDGWNGFSAAGYFFGRELHARLGVPVGLIEANWGGTPAQAWTPIDYLKADPDFDAYVKIYHAVAALPKGELEKLDALRVKMEADMRQRAHDPGNQGERDGWQKPGLDLAGWEKTTVPSGWFADKNIYGAVWFRRTVTVPAAWAGQNAVLDLGIIDDYDTAYFNGEKIGATGPETPSWWTTSRHYRIPGRLLKAGENVVAVRIFNDYCDGGFMSKAADLGLALDTDAATPIPLAGDWHRKIETALKTFPRLVLPFDQNTPSVLYNGMIAPLIPYAIRGAIWYQGESNAGAAYEYRKLFPTMIRAWRDRWGEGAFPFYFVQLANFMPAQERPGDSAWAELREAQSLTLGNTFNTGMAVCIDIGETADVHPKNKQEVGRRLALNALASTYGKDVAYSGPVCRSQKIEGGAIRLFFDHAGNGLKARSGEPLKGFAVCGPDHAFVWADAKIEGETVVVASPKVGHPVAVRYAWADNPVCNLVNSDGLPASPFRTDAFRGITQP